MSNIQKRKLLTFINKTTSVLCFIAILCAMYCNIDMIVSNLYDIIWFNIVLIVVTAVVLMFLFSNMNSIKNFKSSYITATLYYCFVIFCCLAIFCLGLYIYIQQIELINYISLLVPILFVILAQLLQLINIIISFYLIKLNNKNTFSIDSVSDMPNFDDELIIKKKIEEIKKKLYDKQIQYKIKKKEKELDE